MTILETRINPRELYGPAQMAVFLMRYYHTYCDYTKDRAFYTVRDRVPLSVQQELDWFFKKYGRRWINSRIGSAGQRCKEFETKPRMAALKKPLHLLATSQGAISIEELEILCKIPLATWVLNALYIRLLYLESNEDIFAGCKCGESCQGDDRGDQYQYVMAGSGYKFRTNKAWMEVNVPNKDIAKKVELTWHNLLHDAVGASFFKRECFAVRPKAALLLLGQALQIEGVTPIEKEGFSFDVSKR